MPLRGRFPDGRRCSHKTALPCSTAAPKCWPNARMTWWLALGRKPVHPPWTAFNITIAQATLRQAAALAGAIVATLPDAPPGQRYRLMRRPVGVVLGVAP